MSLEQLKKAVENEDMLQISLLIRSASVSDISQALIYACMGTLDTSYIVLLLVEQGADINVKGDWGRTALHFACNKGHIQSARILMHHSADIDAEDTDRWTPLHHANNKMQIECIKLLVERGANVNAKDGLGLTPLHHACRDGHKDCVQLLLDSGAYVNARDVNKCTPLHEACDYDNLECAQILVGVGADTSITNDMNETALDVAIMQNHTAISAMLENA